MTPGTGLNNPEGFVDLTDPAQVHSIVVPSVTGTVSVPLSVLPFWVNDGGVRSYGGASHISLFENGGVEGTSSGDIVAVTKQPIDEVGVLTLDNPDPNKIYAVRVRLRSSANDGNYRDFVATFRVTTPLAVPLTFDLIDDADLPEIEFDSEATEFNFATVPVNTEIRLRAGGDGILLPTTTGNFSADAKNWLLSQMDRARDGLFVVDYLRSGDTDASARVVYAYVWSTGSYTLKKVRRRDFSGWGQYGGSDLGVAVATISNTDPVAANLQFTRNTYGIGPDFETLVVIGNAGSMNIDPTAVQLGELVDISAVVSPDFGNRMWRRFSNEDLYVTLVGVTDTQVIVRQIPLWYTVATHYTSDTGPQIADVNAAPTQLLDARLVLWPYVQFPNWPVFYQSDPGDPSPTHTITGIELYDETDLETPATSWSTAADLWGEMVALRLPDAGVTIPVLDVRSYLNSAHTRFVLRYTVDDGEDEYTITSTYPLNVDGVPATWQRPDLDLTAQHPTFWFDSWGVLKVHTPDPWGIDSPHRIDVEGDAGSTTISAPTANTEYTKDLRATVMSRQASYVRVGWTVSGVLTEYLLPTIAATKQLQGSNTLGVVFDGNTVLFPPGGLDQLDGDTVTLVGDVGSVDIHSPVEGVVYRLGLWGKGNRLFSNPACDHIDVHFAGVDNASIIRVPNTFYEFREQGQANQTIALANRSGRSTGGLQQNAAYNFTLPRMLFNTVSGELEFEDDGSRVNYNFNRLRITSGKTGKSASFQGALLTETGYDLGDAGVNLALGDIVVVSALHASGHVNTVGYRLTAAYSAPFKLSAEGLL